MDSNVAVDVQNIGELEYSRTIADLPCPKGRWYFGNSLELRGRQSHLIVAKWIREFGSIFRFDAMGTQMVVVADRDATDSILRDRPAGFRRSKGTKVVMNELSIGGVLTAEGEEWRRQRKLVMGGLSVDVVRNFFPTMIFMTERLLQRWKAALAEGKAIELHRDMKSLALDIIMGIATGHDLNTVGDDEKKLVSNIDNMMRRLEKRLVALFPHWRHFKLPVDREVDKSIANVKQTLTCIIRNTRERMSQQPHLHQKPTNMLEAMIASSDNPESGFTEHELLSNAILNVIGGEDTTANTLAWMINLLAENPAAGASLAAEIDTVLGSTTVARDWEQMKQLPYLEAVHTETQRLRAVAPLIGVVSNADCTVAGVLIPKDTPIIVSTTGEGMDEAHFPQHELFKPERWIFDQKPHREDDPARKLFPFGGGTRMCPGRFLALTQIKLVISMIMRNFELELDTDAPPVEQVMNFFIGPSAVPVRLKLRF
ncbi:cytochrome P450 [Rhodanobacter sp. A1T4]|uniref:cytochrome P450 n=1 Tax=Rhodanobacter sp. A1T4 TaxID=2723087 RepID=UPI00161D0F81|nr:cytochrome P450 [Rhodanobacter sp. A1T4]MBB6246734.1 cytochrome P450 [Rhodanobacter sp. A1T4]